MRYEVVNSEDIPDEIGAMNGTVGMAAYDGDEIVAYVGFIKTVTLDPLWIRPDKRKSPFLLRRLWEKSKAFLKGAGAVEVGGVTLGRDQETAEIVERIAKRLTGANVVEARFLHIDLTK